MTIYAFISIAVLALSAALIRRYVKVHICPVCVGVSGTWLWLLTRYYLGYPSDIVLIALLMGGSVVGITYTADRRLPKGRSSMSWKMSSIFAGLLTVDMLLKNEWLFASLALLLWGLAALWFFRKGSPIQKKDTSSELEDKMKQCC